jgi:hypothetical protein
MDSKELFACDPVWLFMVKLLYSAVRRTSAVLRNETRAITAPSDSTTNTDMMMTSFALMGNKTRVLI